MAKRKKRKSEEPDMYVQNLPDDPGVLKALLLLVLNIAGHGDLYTMGAILRGCWDELCNLRPDLRENAS